MAIVLHPTIQSGKDSIHKYVSFHDSDNSTLFYQEINIPFTLMLVTCHPDTPDSSVVSFFTPDTQYNFVPDASFKEKKKNISK